MNIISATKSEHNRLWADIEMLELLFWLINQFSKIVDLYDFFFFEFTWVNQLKQLTFSRVWMQLYSDKLAPKYAETTSTTHVSTYASLPTSIWTRFYSVDCLHLGQLKRLVFCPIGETVKAPYI